MSGLYWGYPDNLPFAPLPEEYPNNPDVDVRDSGDDYLIDIEVPGVKNTADVHLDWTSSRSFVLSGESLRHPLTSSPMKLQSVHRPGTAEVVESGMDDAATSIPKKSTGYERNGSVGHKHNAKEEVQAPGLPHLLAGERRVGFFKRVFTLPCEVDVEKVSAKLEAGLLSLKVPKHQSAKGKGSITIISAD
ncbi:Heat shock 70 kDa protein 1A [Elasticomyces elasticus]|nr:Heat shock 70 kDa protein 1A [Elasticomyces elasticus]